MKTTMKLADLKRSNKFTHDLLDEDGETKLPIAITGYKKKSGAFQAIEAKRNPPEKETTVMFKGKQSSVKAKNLSPEDQMNIAAEAVTAITGIDGFECTAENVLSLFKSDETEWIYFQWRDALEDSGKNSNT